MSAFFSKLFILYQSKIAKNAVFAMCCEILIAEVRLCFNLVRKCRSAIANYVALQQNQKVYWGSFAALQKLKQLYTLLILRCAFTGRKDCCAFDIMLFVPTSDSIEC